MPAEILKKYEQRPEGFDPLAGHPDSEQLMLNSLNQASMLAGREKPFSWELDSYLYEGALT